MAFNIEKFLKDNNIKHTILKKSGLIDINIDFVSFEFLQSKTNDLSRIRNLKINNGVTNHNPIDNLNYYIKLLKDKNK